MPGGTAHNVALLCCQSTLLLMLLAMSPAAQPVGLQPVLLHGVFPSQVQDFHLSLLNFIISYQPNPLAYLGPFDWWPCSWAYLTGLPSSVSWKLGENTLHWLFQVIDTCKTEQVPLQTCAVLVTSLQAEDNPLTTTFWNQLSNQFFYPLHQFSSVTFW